MVSACDRNNASHGETYERRAFRADNCPDYRKKSPTITVGVRITYRYIDNTQNSRVDSVLVRNSPLSRQ